MSGPAQLPPRPIVVGWKELVDLPALGVARLKAKIDTGARTSALHVSSLRTLASFPDGSREIELTLTRRRRPGHLYTARLHTLREITVTDSGGHRELRPLIETEMVLGEVRKKILLTLTDRSQMLFPMIIGRKALESDFLVDVSRRYLTRPLRRRSTTRAPAEP